MSQRTSVSTEDSEEVLELQSSTEATQNEEKTEESSIDVTDKEAIKEPLAQNEKDDVYTAIKTPAERASQKKIVKDKVKATEEATLPEDDYLTLDYEPESESIRENRETGVYELPNARPEEDDIEGHESGKVAAVPSPANTLARRAKDQDDDNDEHYLSTDEIVSLPPSSGTIVRPKSNASSVITQEESAEPYLKAGPPASMRKIDPPSIKRPESNLSADSIPKVKDTLLARSDMQLFEERARSSTLMKKRPTLEELSILSSLQANPYHTVLSPAIPTSPRPPPIAEQWMIEPTYSSYDEEKRDGRKYVNIQTLIIIFLVALIIMGIIAIVILGVNVKTLSDFQETANILGTPLNPAMSCAEIAAAGFENDGIYDLQTNREKYEAFCDLSTDGGGWTLVASIHENNLMRVCDCNDLWSSYDDREVQQFVEPCAWDNMNIFGHPVSVTNTDYKGRGYFELNSSDVMIWQVPNNTPLGMTKQRALFRYRTDSGFLKTVRGNLRNFFLDIRLRATNGIYIRSVTTILNQLQTSLNSLLALLSNPIYEYQLERPNSVLDEIFSEPGGHRVKYEHPGCSINLQYGQDHRCYQSGLFVSSRKIVPFISLAGILNEDDLITSLTVTVSRPKWTTCPGNCGRIETLLRIEGARKEPAIRSTYSETIVSLVDSSYSAAYVAVNNEGSANSTQFGYSDVFFIVYSSESWDSEAPTQLTVVNHSPTFPNENGVFNITNSVTITGEQERFMLGTLLVADNGTRRPTRRTIRDIVTGVLEIIVLEGELDITTQTNALVSPVVFDFGTSAQVMSRLPPRTRDYATAGYVQFFTYGYTGYPTAFCPGIKTNSPHPEYVCIGGMSEYPNEICNDFRGWGGLESDPIIETSPAGFAHARRDITTTFMIFYR